MCVSLAWTILNGDTKRVFAPVSFVDKHDLGEWTLLSRPDGIKKDAVHYCGVDRGFKDYKWLYFTNFNTGDPSTIMDTGICVSHCPFHKAKVDDLVYITYGGIDSLDLTVEEKGAKLDKTLNFTFNNPNGAYKSSEFGPLHLCTSLPASLMMISQVNVDTRNDEISCSYIVQHANGRTRIITPPVVSPGHHTPVHWLQLFAELLHQPSYAVPSLHETASEVFCPPS